MSRCMGGWCSMRDKCDYYRPGAAESGHVFERLCTAGATECFQPMRFIPWAR